MILNFSQHKHGNDLLLLLLAANDYITADSLQQRLHISRRSLFYLINKVNEELDQKAEFPITNVKKLGYYLPKETLQFLKKIAQKESSTRVTANTVQQRQLLIIFSILNSQGRSLADLTYQFDVSRNTIIRDLKTIRLELEGYRLTLINTGTGKIIDGSSIDTRKWVYDHANQLKPLINMLDNPVIQPQIVNSQIKLFERITGKYLTDDARTTLQLFLFWYLNNSQDQSDHFIDKSLTQSDLTLDHIWAQSFLNDCQINNPSEADYLVKLVNSSQFSHVNWNDALIQKLKPFAIRMISSFNHLSGAHVAAKTIGDSLTVHLLSTYYRSQYGMPFEYADLKNIKQHYHHTFEITRKVVVPFEQYIHQSLSDDEVALIAIYFGGALREQKTSTPAQNEVLVVCSSGIGTSRLLLQQLESRYRGIHFSSPINVLQYENSDLSNSRLVISTIRLQSHNALPIITVSAFPSKLEWKIIDNAIIKAGLATSDTLKLFNIDTLLDIMGNYAMITNPDGLKLALNDYLNQLTQEPLLKNIHEDSSELIKLLPSEHIGYLTHQKTWQQAVRTAMAPLVADYSIEKNYVDQIIALTNQNGPYMVIGSGVMLAHAAPRDGVNSLGATFFLLDKPLSVMSAQKEVRLIIGLAPIDFEKHLAFISDLMKQLQQKDWLSALYRTNSYAELLKYLQESKE
ncbi:BglG family transcription antiterminator [Lactiplantibacillus herbarum]|uniref:BglG family transcription antiterminator n=1 Tax=Lactiplantibacillus herbarum TaxID=1670446 RepID=UPI00064F3C1C|nr:PTS sugar transporter subunit IIA [Lactiplantibacillus herbarum]